MSLFNAAASLKTAGASKYEYRQREARFGFNTLGEVIPVPHQGGSRNITLIAAMDEDGGIGMANTIPWNLPPDMRQFRKLTLGHTVIMGRKTHASLPFNTKEGAKVLPGRMNIVMTRDHRYPANHSHPQLFQVRSIEAALELCGEQQIYVIGGAEVYREALPMVDDMIITEIEDVYPTDTKFPSFNANHFLPAATSHHDHLGLGYSFLYIRRIQQELIPVEGIKYERFVSAGCPN